MWSDFPTQNRGRSRASAHRKAMTSGHPPGQAFITPRHKYPVTADCWLDKLCTASFAQLDINQSVTVFYSISQQGSGGTRCHTHGGKNPPKNETFCGRRAVAEQNNAAHRYLRHKKHARTHSPLFFDEKLDQSRRIRVCPLQFILAGWCDLHVDRSSIDRMHSGNF